MGVIKLLASASYSDCPSQHVVAEIVKYILIQKITDTTHRVFALLAGPCAEL